jgi:type II secretory ATPase GspE/PulE/Tfp pilus assembly ATPase PilB-like protein
VRPADGLTFSRALRSILRQDPDIIMIGELRDLETAQVAVQAALTGHLVLSTMHTNDAVDTLRRLTDMGLEPFLLNAAVTGVIAQRLVRKLCPHCRQACQLQGHQAPPQALAMLDRRPGVTVYGPGRCDKCGQSGYKGRIAIHEILVMDDALRRAITPAMDPKETERIARQNGMKTLFESGMERVLDGVTSLEEVLRVVPPPSAVTA